MPLFGLTYGYLYGQLTGGSYKDDSAGLGAVMGLAGGIVASLASLILGTVVSFVMRNNPKQHLSMIGYFIPSGLFLLYLLVTSLFDGLF